MAAAPPFTLELRVDGLDETLSSLQRMPAAIRRELPAATRQTALLIRKTAREGVSGSGSAITLGKRTGGFMRSIRMRKIAAAKYAIGSTHPAAAIHEFGGTTRPHIIRAKNAEALRFMLGGKVVFARSVRHPGSKIPPRPWLRPAVEKSRKGMQGHFRAAVRKGFQRAGFGKGTAGGSSPFTRIGFQPHQLATHTPEVESAAAALAEVLRGG